MQNKNLHKAISLLMIILIMLPKYTFSQNIELKKSELKKLGDKIINSDNSQIRLQANDRFKTLLNELLESKKSFNIDFSHIFPLYIIYSPDKKFRILSWSVKKDESAWQYHSILQLNSKKNKIIELNNFNNANINTSELQCIYYAIIPPRRRKFPYYTLIGWRKKNNSINTKIIEPLYIKDNEAILGATIFDGYNKNSTYRLVFDYPNTSNLLIEYQAKSKRIIIEHLSTTNNNLYLPDGSYDALEFNNNSWRLIKNVNP